MRVPHRRSRPCSWALCSAIGISYVWFCMSRGTLQRTSVTPSVYTKQPTTPVPHRNLLPLFPPTRRGAAQRPRSPRAAGGGHFPPPLRTRAILRLAATTSPTPPWRPIAERIAASSPIEGAGLRGGAEPRRAGLLLIRRTALCSSPAAASPERPPRR